MASRRDLKPGNLLLTGGPDPVLKVADFGLAKAYEFAGQSGLTRRGASMGTEASCPRRQMANALDVGPEVDVWAAAACLHAMLTGYPPRARATDFVSVPIRERRSDLPEALADLIDRALVERREEPAVAFASAAAFREALVSAMQ